MTVDQIIRHYGSPTEASKALGYSLQTFRNWRKNGIPGKSQSYVEYLSKRALKADAEERRRRAAA